MDITSFEDTLRTFIRRKPFLPFIVELANGEEIIVTQPTIAFDAGAAGYLTDTDLKEFACEEVRHIRAFTVKTNQ